ncbi:lycopene cyclase family protein [Actimicrobium antarcticum]|uniref:Lycopene cyclase family protein n=1 Tax=Actimicrobium antarcticum TaxID=1051899 RepID=A0ABP7U136_9BURK
MTFDIVIVGGGLSGLALAAELARPEFSRLRVLVLEARATYTRDRTWSYWQSSADAGHRYSHLERRQWLRWCVRQEAAASITHRGKTQSYCSLDGDLFYAAAQRAIAQSDHVELRLNSPVCHVTGAEMPSVETVGGEVIRATWVFDARPPTRNNASALVQQFVGCEITTDRDVFDPTTVELMQFFPSTDGLHFFYVLPYSSRNALVESTWISPASLTPDFGNELKHFITNSLGLTSYDVVYEEKGVLHLGMNNAASDMATYVVPLGRAAGTLRPSTGYAFLETLAHAEQIAASMERHLMTGELKDWVPTVFKRAALDTWMDTVFLHVLARDWSKGPGYFMQLFKKLDTNTMVAFLSGKANWWQRLMVASALPVLPFTAQALATWIAKVPRLLRARR